MRKLVKSIAFRFLRALGTWLTNEKNLPRLRVVQEFFERAAGHPTAVCLAQQKYPGLIFDQSKKARLRNFQQKFYSQFSEDGLIILPRPDRGAQQDLHRIRHRGRHRMQRRAPRDQFRLERFVH